MNRIITLTVNPAIDKSTTVAGIKPNSKLRCSSPVYEAGGGGINVSRVLHELGGTSLCMYMAGGPTGSHLNDMLVDFGIPQLVVPIEGWVRENIAVTDTKNKEQYRFGMPGPMIKEQEWKKTLEQLEAVLTEGDILVASGSLCPGMPTDFFARISKIAGDKNVKYILDTSGEALLKGARTGVYLLKPNLGELATLCGVKTISFLELESIAQTFLKNNPCEVLVVSLGPQGAVMLTAQSVDYISAPIVCQKSTIGAGDSMVAGMVLALAQGKSLQEMAKYGVACGTAATMTSGTQLCKRKDVEELNDWISSNSSTSQKIKINV
ncbi:1-phosphofructokinase family hexose kinase [Maribacter sp. PR1]|uniref:1-phosphofructokinase family hexose kinase n=1 Tax=Maribacter cobaltidurans TaxID=1178778 RepID=A0ABU7IU04_9FLAO|nr:MULTISPECIES: 1-phosphofructokinase family hexose kinase [Maribacter]MDC6389078.1 1-phosphofructokinase family hexose kinase [Maribacter sp. PR1]MEE1976465.1 1-phosphofructokinase family hexose kinase [Maribacter cobaltidurans]